MQREYIILRDANRSAPLHYGPAAQSRRIPPLPKIDTGFLTPSDVRDLSRDPMIAAIAPTMPTTLIAPFEVAAEALVIDWGISAIRADISAFTGTGVVVSVLDTGIDATHPALLGVVDRRPCCHRPGHGAKEEILLCT